VYQHQPAECFDLLPLLSDWFEILAQQQEPQA
jgi:hypothetical protein